MTEGPMFELHEGTGPLIVSVPHDGRQIPETIAGRMTFEALAIPDTDWHVAELYDFVPGLDATFIRARLSRYVVDLNRPADGQPLYPGRFETRLVPSSTFGGALLYRAGQEPTEDEISERIEAYWQPYHRALREQLDRVKSVHGRALLWDAHSIPSRMPSLFEGELPHLSLGSAQGMTCDPVRRERVIAELTSDDRFTSVVDGRFKGGFITRGYGDPENGVDALQLEIAQRAYMDETQPRRYDPELAASLQSLLRRLLKAFAS